ncbi:hypothetical protein Glove_341g2 [Diversispora epigaea]|uniref:Crinkler effector protein N-terminal domain-containing protein n=1 Tax=Diversispora epigaea TaxID=1348612 RepID=A0A397HKW9_9GLOM|nr:hypothetical protein Glove_341g2 [Diversispora epigaea]
MAQTIARTQMFLKIFQTRRYFSVISTVHKIKLNAMVIPKNGTRKNDFITIDIPHNENFSSLKKEVLKHTSFQNVGEDQITVGFLKDKAEIEEVFEKYNKEKVMREETMDVNEVTLSDKISKYFKSSPSEKLVHFLVFLEKDRNEY